VPSLVIKACCFLWRYRPEIQQFNAKEIPR
jgi:hypothetical protein